MQYQLQFGILYAHLDTLLGGLWVTIYLSFLGIVGGVFFGVAGAIATRSRYAPIRWTILIYVELVRNTPLLIQLLVIFFGLPSIGIHLSPLAAASIVLVLNNTGYIVEIVRGGIESTLKGQYEAAAALGLSNFQTMRFVVLPPALKKVLQPVISQSVLLMLSTSVVSTIGVQELTGAAMQVSSNTFRALELYLAMSTIYVLLGVVCNAMANAAILLIFRRPSRQTFRKLKHA